MSTSRPNGFERTDTIEYLYDSRNRLVEERFIGRSVDNRVYEYDAASRLRSVQEPGKNGLADVFYEYDALGRLISESSNGVTHTYEYDENGNRTRIEYGGTGRVITCGFDALNRLTSMLESGRTTTYEYDLKGNVRAKTLGNGERIEYIYDALSRCKEISAPHYLYRQSYDAAGSVRKIVEDYDGVLTDRTLTMKYDGAYRLIEERVEKATGNLATAYQYDNANNRTRLTRSGLAQGTVVTNYDYSNSLNQLEGFTETGGRSVSYAYDLNGNRIRRTENGQATNYSYDYLNRLTGVTKSADSYGYAYDYRTRRVLREENGTATDVVFSGGLSVREIENGATTVEFVRGSDVGGGVGGMLYSLRNGQPSYTHSNHRGDVASKTNASGTVTYAANYHAFGEVENEFGATLDRQRHSTKEQDPTGLVNVHNRYLDPEAGIWLTRDPAGFVDGPNLYAYVGGNPWSSFDPEGLFLEEFFNGVWNFLNGGAPEERARRDAQWQEYRASEASYARELDTANPLSPNYNWMDASYRRYLDEVQSPNRISFGSAEALDRRHENIVKRMEYEMANGLVVQTSDDLIYGQPSIMDLAAGAPIESSVGSSYTMSQMNFGGGRMAASPPSSWIGKQVRATVLSIKLLTSPVQAAGSMPRSLAVAGTTAIPATTRMNPFGGYLVLSDNLWQHVYNGRVGQRRTVEAAIDLPTGAIRLVKSGGDPAVSREGLTIGPMVDNEPGVCAATRAVYMLLEEEYTGPFLVTSGGVQVYRKSLVHFNLRNVC